MISFGEYGVVIFTAGKWAGRMGWYDDETDDGRRAIVYFGEPFRSGYATVWRAWLRPATKAEVRWWQRHSGSDPHTAALMRTLPRMLQR